MKMKKLKEEEVNYIFARTMGYSIEEARKIRKELKEKYGEPLKEMSKRAKELYEKHPYKV